MCEQTLLFTNPDQKQWNHKVPAGSHLEQPKVPDWHKRYPGAVAKEIWFKHTQKRELSLLNSLGGKVTAKQTYSDLSLLRNISSYQNPLNVTQPTRPRTD